MNNDPLEKLFEKPAVLDLEAKKTLAGLIEPFAKIDPESGRIYTTKNWANLVASQKILICLLARLALSTKDPNFLNISAREIEEITELPGGTVRPNLRKLVKEVKVASQTPDGLYFIKSSSISLNNAKAFLEDSINLIQNFEEENG